MKNDVKAPFKSGSNSNSIMDCKAQISVEMLVIAAILIGAAAFLVTQLQGLMVETEGQLNIQKNKVFNSLNDM